MAPAPTSSPRRNSSGDSQVTSQSDPQKWFNRSNRNPTGALDPVSMDVDPPFFQKETDSSNEELREMGSFGRSQAYPYAHGGRQVSLPRPAAAQSSSADDYRSVIDDLTIENKRLKEELKRYKQIGPDMMKKEKLFEIKMHGLPKRKKRELEATLRDFAASLEGSSESPSQRRKTGRHGKKDYYSGESISKHASSSSSHSRLVADSAYASMSHGPNSNAPNSSTGPSLGRSSGPRSKPTDQTAEGYLKDTPDGLFPRHMQLTEKERKKLVVRRLEQLFTGKITGKNFTRNHTLPPAVTPAVSNPSLMAPPRNSEAMREAQIQPPDPTQRKPVFLDNTPMSNSNGDQTESAGNGMGGGGEGDSGGRSGNNTSPPTSLLPEQRPTRPRDLDPDRVQVPSENLEYIRHLNQVTPEFLVGQKSSAHNVSPDADGWVYLNLLCNLAQLHMINVTPAFIRSAVSEKSTKFQLSPDGRKIRWRGGTDGTKFSSDSGGENSQKSPSTDVSDESSVGGQRKKQKTFASEYPLTSTDSLKEAKFVPQLASSGGSFHYKPLFVHRSSSIETSLEGTGSQASDALAEESNVGHSKWDYSGSGSSRKKRRNDGAIIYYSGAPFCTDLSGDPGDMSPTTYLTSSGQELESVQSPLRFLSQRTLSGSSLAIRPLSESRAIASEALDMDFDTTPELIKDDGGSPNDEDLEFPWCDEPSKVQYSPMESFLEPCGLGGVLPEDHFAIVVTSRRPILSRGAGNPSRTFRSLSEDFAQSIANRLASMRTSSPLPPRSTTSSINIEYLSHKVLQLKPVSLPPPAMFFPPFSSDSDDSDSEGDDDELDYQDDDMSDENISEELISQRANPHHSDNHDDDDVPSQDEGGFDSGENDDFMSEDSGLEAPPRQQHIPLQRVVSGGSGGVAADKRGGGILHTGSSVATAGDAESGKEGGAPSNPRGIPYAPFVDKVEDYVTTRADVEPTLRSFQEMIAKYQFMEQNLQRRVAGLKDKMPDIQKTLDTVRFLKLRKDDSDPIETTFELNETLHAKAEIPPTDEVYLWLGANVMLSYSIDEAEELLDTKLKAATLSLSNCEEDLDFLREQITTMEVAVARVYNWDVVQKRKEKEEEDKLDQGKGKDKDKPPGG
ncbi:frequency clock protein [Bombardia bombarda]|uniref:Frequency clock protein n=1 Tax=Bombardia bombarda TaxID=252184 RepID=A0AA39X0Z5_9PEZI|nr:frequency clock protein [Bombardia bombarda]